MTTEDWCAGWIAGFAAAAYLYSGHYGEYAKGRDVYLAHKGWEHPMSRFDESGDEKI